MFDFTHLSKRNDAYARRTICVANGAEFVVFDMPKSEMLEACGMLYLHVHRKIHKCYIGITEMRAATLDADLLFRQPRLA